MAHSEIVQKATQVLSKNDRGSWTIPSSDLYPHQWLWDSCFIAIGLAHIDPERAATELRSLLRGQWKNGMVPHMVFSKERGRDARFWDSKSCADAPADVDTSGITQPPLLAEATRRVAEALSAETRSGFLREMVPAILRHHAWLYRERDPQGNGLVLLLHPWETGLDNTPSWIREMRHVHTPHWLRLVDVLRINSVINMVRRDTKHVPADQRAKIVDLLRMYHAQQDLRRRHYDPKRVLANPHRHFIVESLSFNSVLIRNNDILLELAKEAKVEMPEWLPKRFEYAKKAINLLCNPSTGVCYHRNFDSHMVEEEPNISIFFPLYSGAVTKQQARQIVNLLKNEELFWPKYPVPSVPLKSEFFSERRYWQGPTWLNTNWLIADGLKRYGFDAEAEAVRKSSIALVEKSGFYEYFSPLSGEGYGTKDFSWTAALAIDFIKQ